MRKGSNAVITYNKKILLLLRDDKPDISEPNKWSIIGGGVEEGEDFDQTLKREIYEETNLKPKNITSMGEISFGGSLHALYLVKLNEEELRELKLGDEGQKLEFFSYRQLKELSTTSIITSFVKMFGEEVRRMIEEGVIPDLKMMSANLA